MFMEVLYEQNLVFKKTSVVCSILSWDVIQNKALCVADGVPCLWSWQLVKPLCTVCGWYIEPVE